jgi:hypothetical protein
MMCPASAPRRTAKHCVAMGCQGERNRWSTTLSAQFAWLGRAPDQTHNPSVAGSSPARPTSLSQWHPHQQVEQQEHAHDQGADESAFDRGSQSVRQMFPPIQESLPPFVFAKSQKIFHVASPAESGPYLRIGEDARPLQSSTKVPSTPPGCGAEHPPVVGRASNAHLQPVVGERTSPVGGAQPSYALGELPLQATSDGLRDLGPSVAGTSDRNVR